MKMSNSMERFPSVTVDRAHPETLGLTREKGRRRTLRAEPKRSMLVSVAKTKRTRYKDSLNPFDGQPTYD